MNSTKQIGQTIIIGTVGSAFTLMLLTVHPAQLNIWQTTPTVLSSGVIAGGVVAVSWIKSCR